ncbi:MlaD family protein [Kitasatospora sp. NPDC094015]|uniref:MlaD family protein n=1 Tax=Kitasatospora sp. NPDC094015 TaxID=3155205 RepID=UPI00332024C0
MLSLGTRLKNLAFVVVAVLVVGYIAVEHADLGRYVGLRGYYRVDVELAQTGGLFEHADVTYRGVSVGRVGPIRLTPDGVRAELRINDSAPRIPSRLQAVVANLSAVGEQYLDLRPATDQPPYLRDGSAIARADTATPAPVTDLLGHVDALVGSVPLDSLRTVVDEFGQAFDGQADNLQALLDGTGQLVSAASAALPATTRLVVDSETVLRTQHEEADAIRGFATGAQQLAGQLAASDTDLRRIIATGPQAAAEVGALVRDVDPGLSVLLANLLTTAELGVTRQHGIEELLVRLPAVAAAGATAVDSGGAHLGMAVTFFSPLPCTTGYGGTTYRNGLDTSPAPAFNTAAGCTAPASSGSSVRGSGNAPKGGVPTPVAPATPAAGGTGTGLGGRSER